MEHKLRTLLDSKEQNYIFPFFWQHGEDESTLREYMQVIFESNIRAVCIESRGHPDFCGEKWWSDMDIILDEARKRGMKVWILDDSHFPTGYANGALRDEEDRLCRQGVTSRRYACRGGEKLILETDVLRKAKEIEPSETERMIARFTGEKETRRFEDDRLLGIIARKTDGSENIKLPADTEADAFCWEVPEGEWEVSVLHLSRNLGYHRDYINMMDQESCRLLIEHVYEPHWERYHDDFGVTIAGFFSDEPELGNGHLYDTHTRLGEVEDLPWSRELEERLRGLWKEDFLPNLTCLWEDRIDSKRGAAARYTYMDEVSRLVEKNFSMQMGEWCRSHRVEYIGHLIEDNGAHARTGSSLGHYFRGLSGQDMAGIDDIGGQVFPQGEDVSYDLGPLECRDGEFYHFMLGKLAGSAAAIDPRKKGRAMCEIFGNYGWSEGVRLEKYLLDHFLVRGVNHFVPHAFSTKDFPDPDCPPHFYAHGNNPQYRHFGTLMKYTNRVCEALSGGRHIAPAAVIYHAEGEWTGKTVLSQQIGRLLTEAQIEYDYLPMDVFAEKERYQTRIRDHVLTVNTQDYQVVILPEMEFVPEHFAAAADEMRKKGIPVICAGNGSVFGKAAEMITETAVRLDEVVPFLRSIHADNVSFSPADRYLRYYQYEYNDGSSCLFLINEGKEEYEGVLSAKIPGSCIGYDAWENCVYPVTRCEEGIRVRIRPLQSMLLFWNIPDAAELLEQGVKPEYQARYQIRTAFFEDQAGFEEFDTIGPWKRSVCRSIEYPKFHEEKTVTFPDDLAKEKEDFSGFVRYEASISVNPDEENLLYISDAREGVEVFVNEESLGIQCVPPFLYVLTGNLHPGENRIRIEVATTLEREMAKVPDMLGRTARAEGETGITGKVIFYKRKEEGI